MITEERKHELDKVADDAADMLKGVDKKPDDGKKH